MSEQSSSGPDRNDTVARDDLPVEVYAAHADFVRLAMKTMTARRLVGWLREYAEYCDVSGNTKTAEHARHLAKRLAQEVDPESVMDCPQDARGGCDE